MEAAAAHGIHTLVLTDINNTSCSFEFINACHLHGIKPVLGIEFRQRHKFLFTGVAHNLEGYRELCEWLSKHSLNELDMPDEAPEFRHCFIVYRRAVKPVEHFKPNEYLGISPHEVAGLYNSSLLDHLDKLIVYNPITFLNEEGFKIHKLLRCIDLNIILGRLTPEDHAHAGQHVYSLEQLQQVFSRYPSILSQTQKLLECCSIRMEPSTGHNRQTFTGSITGDERLLRKLATDGCTRRYGGRNGQAMQRTRRELQVIVEMGFASYFLITWDLVRYAQSAGYRHVGRGSGANSIVAYCLYLTDVDPLELDLYFERFINPHRTSPPDFDIDFSWDDRDDVIDYVLNRYGRDHTALLATYNTFKGKSIIRELGKVFGLPKAEIDLIVNEPLADHKHHPYARYIFKYGKSLEGFPNYLSIHAGGIVISEKPLFYHTALQLMPKGFPITHFDMYSAEERGFHKYDVLSQRGLGHIKDTVELIRKNRGAIIDIHNVGQIKEDTRVRAQLRSGHCLGCFYIESPAMRGLLHKLRCESYVQLVAASSIIRPGVAKSGMMREYIKRFYHPETITYLHPIFEEHLAETYGVMVYQEDVMKIVHHFAGLDLDESDVLRRIMTGKKKSSDTFRKLRDKYFRNCEERGYPDQLIKEVWRQIESFSGYSFCKAHSASFAVESFQSLYLKTYYPLEFMVGVINNFGGFYRTEVYVHEARMSGGDIQAPCVNRSSYLTTIQDDQIFIGLVHIHSLEKKVAERVVEERLLHGDFRSLDDFVNRVDIGKEQLELLIRVGAFRFTGLNKHELMWERSRVHNPQLKIHHTVPMFARQLEATELPKLEESRYEQAFDEMELLGFPLCSPFDLLPARSFGEIAAAEMPEHTGQTVRMLGYFITRKNVTTVNRKLMNFGTWIDRAGHFFDTIHFPPCLAKYPFMGIGCYLVQGKIVEDFDFPSLEVEKMAKLPYVNDPRY